MVGRIEERDRIGGGDSWLVVNIVGLVGRRGVDIIGLGEVESVVYVEVKIVGRGVVL